MSYADGVQAWCLFGLSYCLALERADWLASPSNPWSRANVEGEAAEVHGEVGGPARYTLSFLLTKVRFFVNLKVSSPIQRNNLFIQPVDGLFHFEPFDEHPVVQKPEDIYLRTELQSLRRLSKSKAIVFSVRTYLTPLTDLKNEPEALERLWDAVRHFPDAVSKHKVRHLWNDVFEAFCKDTLGREDPEIDPDTGDGIGTKSMGEAKTCPAGFA